MTKNVNDEIFKTANTIHNRKHRNELHRRKQRGIKRKIFNAPRGGELNLYPPRRINNLVHRFTNQRLSISLKSNLSNNC
jgi:hypothetical protein